MLVRIRTKKRGNLVRTRMGTFAAAALMAVLAAVCMAATAGAKPVTRTVYAGPPSGVSAVARKYLPKSFAALYQPDINAFFNRRTTINAGDTVSFVLHGFHTIDLPGSSGTDLPLIVPGPTVGNVLDAGGNPFWFDGKVPSVGFNPQLFARSKGRTYNGTSRLDSGLPIGGPPKPFNVKFTKPGVYRFFCDVHYGMVGFVVVKAKGVPIPSVKQAKAARLAQVISDIKAAKKVATSKIPADTVSLGESTPGGVELFAMFPSTLTVNAGTAVTFKMSRFTRETHTASFGPQPYLNMLAGTFNGPAPSPVAVYPSSPPGTISETPTSHGNGFANAGTLDRDATTPLPSSGTIDFTTPGTYHFQCLIHPFMRGTIIVR